MATYITVEQKAAQQLLEANARQTAANRLGLAQQEKAKQQPPELPPPQVNPSRQPVLSTEELAAFRFNRRRGLSHFHWYTYGSQNNNYWRIYSGDASVYVDGEYQSPAIPVNAISNSSNFYTSWIVLPVEGDLLIAVMVGRRRDAYRLLPNTPFSLPYAISRAYACTSRTVRQVQVPPALEVIIDLLNPTYLDSDYDSYSLPTVDTTPFPPRQIYPIPSGWVDPSLSEEWSPTTFELLNLITQFINPSQIRQFPAAKLPLTYDSRAGYYANSQTDRSFYYAEWLGDPDTVDTNRPDLLQSRPDLTLKLPVDFVFPSPPESPSDPDYGTVPGDNGTMLAWDWDDPGYCRQMLLALGFTAGDLTP